MGIRWSQSHFPTLRHPPNDAEVASHRLLVQAGYIRQIAAGVYTLLPLAKKALARIERVIREEMDAIGAQEFELPALLPAEQWKQSGRWDVMGPNMFRLKDRKNGDFCLGMTHEEVFAWLAHQDVRSYKELPQIWYQIQTKFRDEARPKSGLLRVREFRMKDSYSLDVSQEGLDKAFLLHRQAYQKIYSRCGLPYMIVDADTGAMGGSASSEFMVATDAGEDWLAACDRCTYAANVEKATSRASATQEGKAHTLEEFPTPGVKTIEALAQFSGGAPSTGQIKTLVLHARYVEGKKELLLALMRGDHELNLVKLTNHLKALEVSPAQEADIVTLLGAHPGSLGAVGLQGKNIKVIADVVLKNAKGMVTGANRDGVHYRGVDVARDLKVDAFVDLRAVKAGDPCPHCEGQLKLLKCLEVGHIFKLGTKYSEALDARVLDQDGKKVPIIMGSFGIGVGRILAAAIEVHHDKDGMKLPPSVAPFDVVISPLFMKTEDPLFAAAVKLEKELSALGLEVLLDDRDQRPGVKFKDADLIGIPIRVVLGEKSFQQGQAELVCRWNGEKSALPLGDVVRAVQELHRRILPQAVSDEG